MHSELIEFYTNYRRVLVALARRRTLPAGCDPEDVVQEMFLNALRWPGTDISLIKKHKYRRLGTTLRRMHVSCSSVDSAGRQIELDASYSFDPQLETRYSEQELWWQAAKVLTKAEFDLVLNDDARNMPFAIATKRRKAIQKLRAALAPQLAVV